jgi:hypothetical protein
MRSMASRPALTCFVSTRTRQQVNWLATHLPRQLLGSTLLWLDKHCCDWLRAGTAGHAQAGAAYAAAAA